MNTILILHGWGSCAQKWGRAKQALEECGFTTIIPDLPGFGQCPAPNRAWSNDDYVAWVKNFSEKHNLSQFFLLGHSFGGRLGIKFAIKYPEKLKGLILVSAAGIRHQAKTISKLVLLFKKILPPLNILRKFFYRFILRKTDYLKAQGIMKEVLKNVVSEDLTSVLSQITVPTNIIWGAKDKITPLNDAYIMKREIPKASLTVLKGIKHCPYLENPKLLAQTIKKLI